MSHRGMPKTKPIRQRLRKEAEERQAEYDQLTLEQKLAKLPATGAVKQRARLEIQKNNPAVQTEEKKPRAKRNKKEAE